uniref:B box-type domain-containing protein n=1 Tax=Magallana gigas TaxID=29159 RepID=A0A8W8JDE2_MAGGI
MEKKSKSEPAARGTEEDLQKNIQGSQNFINEEKSASNKRGCVQTVTDEDKSHEKQDLDEAEQIDTNNQLFHERNIAQTDVPDYTMSSQSLLSCTRNLSTVEKENISHSEKLIFRRTPNHDIKNKSKKEIDEKELCEPCSSENLSIQATNFCQTCDDPELLCEFCAKHHTKQKPFKDHKLSNDIGDFLKSKKKIDETELCEPCSSESLSIQATHFCQTCDDPELLCEFCAKHHTKQKPFKDHKLSNDIGDFRKSAKWLCKSMLCEPCFTENQLIQATHFCRTCYDPELLCEFCAKHHTKQKPFKDHKLSNDIGDFLKSEKKIDERKLCEHCFSENKHVQATHFCRTCDDPELLCETCAKHHTKQKQFKDHELSNAMGDFQKR